MSEWHLPPDYIMSHWTEELLVLMIDKLIDRKNREVAAMSGHSYSGRVVSDDQFFREAGIKVQKVNRGN
ncbi:MAG: hypothetical protein MUP81_00255 [Dehalococcoidia bacterium]|nr:hypothetical protein [Dehalococcoidia bacterium]